MLFAFLDFRRVRRKMPVEAPVDDAPSIRERGRQRQVRSGLKALFNGIAGYLQQSRKRVGQFQYQINGAGR